MTTQVSVSVPPGADYFAHVVTEYRYGGGDGEWRESTVYDVMPGQGLSLHIWSGVRLSRIEERVLIDIHSNEYIAPTIS